MLPRLIIELVAVTNSPPGKVANRKASEIRSPVEHVPTFVLVSVHRRSNRLKIHLFGLCARLGLNEMQSIYRPQCLFAQNQCYVVKLLVRVWQAVCVVRFWLLEFTASVRPCGDRRKQSTTQSTPGRVILKRCDAFKSKGPCPPRFRGTRCAFQRALFGRCCTHLLRVSFCTLPPMCVIHST